MENEIKKPRKQLETRVEFLAVLCCGDENWKSGTDWEEALSKYPRLSVETLTMGCIRVDQASLQLSFESSYLDWVEINCPFSSCWTDHRLRLLWRKITSSRASTLFQAQ